MIENVRLGGVDETKEGEAINRAIQSRVLVDFDWSRTHHLSCLHEIVYNSECNAIFTFSIRVFGREIEVLILRMFVNVVDSYGQTMWHGILLVG